MEQFPASDVVTLDYGTAGNVVHTALEKYLFTGNECFDEVWNEMNGDSFTGFGGRKINKEQYYEMFKRGVEFIKTNISSKKGVAVPEYAIKEHFYDIDVKGFIDVFFSSDTAPHEYIIYDWKTNSSDNYLMHKDQRLFYSWLFWKTRNIIPSCEWVYLKSNRVHKDVFTKEQLELFDLEIQQFLSAIKIWGMDKTQYALGDWKSPYNQYISLCEQEVERRTKEEFVVIHLSIKGSIVFFEGDVPTKLLEGVDYATKFDEKNKYFQQEAVRKKARGVVNLEDIGTIHLFNHTHKCFPIGLLDKVTLVCEEYAAYFNKKIKIYLYDKRDTRILEQTTTTMPDALLGGKEIRPYQKDAIDAFMQKKSGVLHIATGGGKTFIACEIIRQCKAKTLWIIDRKELLDQTKLVLEKELGVEVGMIKGNVVDIKDITIATIQSLHAKLFDLRDYLYCVNMVVVDEFHKSAAETYQKVFSKLPNTKYRLGLTATPIRDDGKEPILFSILNEVIYTITSQELIQQGYLIHPKVVFYKVDGFSLFKKSYVEDYTKNIVENYDRNICIADVCNTSSQNNKVLVLVKLIEHGKMLEKMCYGARYIHGKTPKTIREQALQEFREGKITTLIMTVSIGAEGLDIPDLHTVINTCANKGDLKSIQIIGRVLRMITGKSNALYVDFIDTGYYTHKHSQARMSILQKEGYTIDIEKTK